jgi:hypothetical protein
MSVEFDPIKLGPRRRRVDPLVVGVLVVVIGLVVAVVKPWLPTVPSEAPGPSAAIAVVPPAPSLGPSQSATRPGRLPAPSPQPSPPPTWTDIAPFVSEHLDWGVEAIFQLPSTPSPGRPSRYDSFWSPAAPGPDGPQSAYIARDDQSIVALGVTFPPGEEVPQDARIWLVHAGDQLEWIDARMVVGGIADGAMLFIRPPIPGVTPSSWPGGHYRIDALVSGQVRRIFVQIPSRLGSVAQPDPWPRAATGLVEPADSDPSSVHVGLFATVNGTAVPLVATPGPLLDEVAEWQRVVGGAGRAPGPTVATAYLPQATGLGVMLTSHASLDSAVVRRLSPDGGFDAGPVIGGVSRLQGRTPYVVFAPRDGGALTPGVYALSIGWTDRVGSHAGTWQVELRPGPVAPIAGIAG